MISEVRAIKFNTEMVVLLQKFNLCLLWICLHLVWNHNNNIIDMSSFIIMIIIGPFIIIVIVADTHIRYLTSIRIHFNNNMVSSVVLTTSGQPTVERMPSLPLVTGNVIIHNLILELSCGKSQRQENIILYQHAMILIFITAMQYWFLLVLSSVWLE